MRPVKLPGEEQCRQTIWQIAHSSLHKVIGLSKGEPIESLQITAKLFELANV